MNSTTSTESTKATKPAKATKTAKAMNAASVTEEIMDTRGELMKLAKKLDRLQANADGQQQPQTPKHVTVDMGAQAGRVGCVHCVDSIYSIVNKKLVIRH